MIKHLSRIRKSKTAKSSMIFVVALIFSHFFNISFNIYLGRSLDVEDFGLVTLIVSLLYFTNIIFLALSATVSHNAAYLFSSKKSGAAANFYKTAKKSGLAMALAFSLVWIILSPQISGFFNIESYLPVILFMPVFSMGTILATNRGFLQGKFKFAKAGLLFLSESLSKLLIAILLTATGFGEWAYIAIPISILTAFSVSIYVTKNETNLIGSENNFQLPFPKKFFVSTIISRLSTMAFLGLDFMLVKHFFNSEEAGYYALLSLVGKIIFFLGDISNNFTIPLVSKDIGEGKNPNRTFSIIFGITFLFVAFSAFMLGPLGNYTAPLIFGEKAIEIVPLLSTFALAIAGFTMANVIVTYHLAKKEYIFPIVSILNAALTGIGIVLYHSSLSQVVSVIFATSIINISSIVILHIFFYRKICKSKLIKKPGFFLES